MWLHCSYSLSWKISVSTVPFIPRYYIIVKEKKLYSSFPLIFTNLRDFVICWAITEGNKWLHRMELPTIRLVVLLFISLAIFHQCSEMECPMCWKLHCFSLLFCFLPFALIYSKENYDLSWSIYQLNVAL